MKWHKFSTKGLLHEHISEFAWFLCESSAKKSLDVHQDPNLLLDNDTERRENREDRDERKNQNLPFRTFSLFSDAFGPDKMFAAGAT